MNDDQRFWYFMFITVTWMASVATAFFFVKTGVIHMMLLAYGFYPGAYFWSRDIGKNLSETAVLGFMLVFPAIFAKSAEVTTYQYFLGVGIGDLVGYFILKLWGKYPFPKDK